MRGRPKCSNKHCTTLCCGTLRRTSPCAPIICRTSPSQEHLAESWDGFTALAAAAKAHDVLSGVLKGESPSPSIHPHPFRNVSPVCKVFIFALKFLINAVANVDHGLLVVYRKLCCSGEARTRAAGLAPGNGRWQQIRTANRKMRVCL